MPRKLSKNRNSLPLDPPTSSSSKSPSLAYLPTWVHDSLPLPRLVVIDLDYTLWPFYTDINVNTPIKLVSSSNHTTVTDRNGELFTLFPDVPYILNLLSHLGIRLAVASKSPVGDLCRDILRLLRLPTTTAPGKKTSEESASNSNDSPGKKTPKGGSTPGSSSGGGTGRKVIEAFDGGLEIYEGTKLHHFDAIEKRTGIPYTEMLFFDDEWPNIEVETLGVTMKLVGNRGLCWAELDEGIQKWRANRGVK